MARGPLHLIIYLFIEDFTTLSSNKLHNIICSWLNVDGYQYWLLVTIIVISFESSLELRCWNMYYKGRVNERYKGCCYQSFFQNVAKSSPLIRVEVGSDMSMIGSTFHKRGTLLKKK